MKRSKILERIRKVRAKYIDIFVDNTFDLSGRIQYLLDKKGMEQKDLARELKKNESEISKWLSGSHNFTLKTLAKIEAVLGERLLEVVANEGATVNKIEIILLKQSTIY
ncbi:transcriptional regulator, XRE family protein [Psychroflexus torquis ATCC 700755]|uniref:Transcriptional regulator, XRE family protein n=1 Tax=Psychroflexus torquis (strain ATCC 700755 / CIP 106069 / ACAM 623) TaxID=313595 RepID=K4II18_PSYTT|nr:helix-turn-helix transcriptional regulator [Psychroflexus torquis]AFU69463.1 transcriptional regulator, XRE family protein [Psychroflexus torquis ATCC 700755]